MLGRAVKQLVLYIIILAFLCSCDERAVLIPDNGLTIDSLGYFSPWGYSRKITLVVNEETVSISVLSEKVIQKIETRNAAELIACISRIKSDLEFGFEAGESSIGRILIDGGGLTFLWNGRVVSLYNTEKIDLYMNEKRLIANYERLKELLSEFNLSNGLY
jgi:hypothetical protein